MQHEKYHYYVTVLTKRVIYLETSSAEILNTEVIIFFKFLQLDR